LRQEVLQMVGQFIEMEEKGKNEKQVIGVVLLCGKNIDFVGEIDQTMKL